MTFYPRGLAQQTQVAVPDISNILCGQSRPGHFQGVATVVCKLFNMVQPDIAIFGKKDYQQLLVIKLMVADLSFPTEIVGVDTARNTQGLALSSRNGYLSAEQKQAATIIYQSMRALVLDIEGGATLPSAIAIAKASLSTALLVPDYP